MNNDVLGMLSSANPEAVANSRRGPNNIMIRCPFHAGGQERTPSCSVHLEQPVFFCHGCKEGGHLSRLLRALGLPGDLAKRMVDEGNFAATPGFVTRVGLYRLYEGPNPYRTQFILDEDVLDDWRLAPKSLLETGFKKGTLRHFEVGFDYQNLRITYPIRNVFGELVGVSGRTVVDQDPRYKLYRKELTSIAGIPEHYELDKRGLLWHAHVIWPVLYKTPEPVIITEGFKATMWVWQSGVHDVVATIGSYLTDLHTNLLSVVRCPIFLFYDNNEAGKIGTWKAIQKLKANELYVANYPDLREQPDDLDPEEVREALRSATSYATWMKENADVIREGEEYPSRKPRFQSSS
jgi:DNA primase